MRSQRLRNPLREEPPSTRPEFFDERLRRTFRRSNSSRGARHRRAHQPERSIIRGHIHHQRSGSVPRNNGRGTQERRTVLHPQLPPSGPPTHTSRRISRLTEQSQHHASYGHYGTSPSTLHPDTGQLQLVETLPGGIGPLSWATPSFRDPTGNMAQHPAAIQTASDVYASQGYTGHGYADQQVAQPSPRTTFTFRDPLPLSTGRINDFTITGPNSQPQPIKAAIDTTYEVSFLAASAANESGCVWEKLPPVPHAIQGPASLFDPCYWVLGVRVDSEFFGIQGMEVDLYLLPDNLFTPGVRIIIGQSMMEMMEMIKRQRRGRNSSTQQVPNSVRGG